MCLHYMVTCGDCIYCGLGSEQFCTSGQMLGKNRDGGYAETISVPARNTFPLPDEIPFEHGAIMMCSSATSFHALRKGRLEAGETVAVFGVGGLGMSAVQLARAFGALDVYAVDINADRLKMAKGLYDMAGNVTTMGPYEVQISTTSHVYLPLVTRHFTPGLGLPGSSSPALRPLWWENR